MDSPYYSFEPVSLKRKVCGVEIWQLGRQLFEFSLGQIGNILNLVSVIKVTFNPKNLFLSFLRWRVTLNSTVTGIHVEVLSALMVLGI